MKTKFSRLLLPLSFVFFGCATKPADKTLKNFPHFNVMNQNKPDLKMYFPEFSNTQGNIVEGDGCIIIFPNNEIMVIDGFYSAAAQKYVSYIKKLGFSKIDYLVASHYHGDHIQSFPELIDNFEIGCFYSPGAPTKSETSTILLNKIKEKSIKHIVLKEGDQFKIDNINFKVYSPDLTDEDIYNIYNNPGKTAKLVNNSSLVFKLTYNNFSMMFTGDVYKKRDKEICKKYGNELKSDLLKVAHHGDYDTANSHTWISTVKPDYGIVIDPRYVSHPWWGYIIKSRYSLHNVILLYNKKEGAITVTSDGKNYSISNSVF